MIDPFAVAVQGLGFGAEQIAAQGLFPLVELQPVQVRFFAGGGRSGGGPDAQVSMTDYLMRFGQSTASRSHPVAATQRRAALRKRQKMEEEVLALMDYF